MKDEEDSNWFHGQPWIDFLRSLAIRADMEGNSIRAAEIKAEIAALLLSRP